MERAWTEGYFFGEGRMTDQSTWIRKDPPLEIGEMVIVTSDYGPLKGKHGKIIAIKGPFESLWMRTDRWMSDWFYVEIEGKTQGFLEDEIERVVE